MSLFIVTDCEKDQQSILKALRVGGYAEIFMAQSVDEAGEKLALDPGAGLRQPVYNVELILISLTSKDAANALCARIKTSVQYQDIPVILFSEGFTAEDFQAAFAFGAADFIQKPIRDFELVGRVRYALKLKFEIDRRKARERELTETTKQLSDLNSMLTRLSLIDSLTGISNRRSFDISFDQEWRRALRNSRPLSLILIDIDYFKLYNDHYGHQAGDECLKNITNIMRKSLKRPGDLLSRYGGEEFAVILPDTPLEGALVVGQSIHQAVGSSAISNPTSNCGKIVTLSAGVASLVPNHNATSQQLIEAADRGLYSAKTSGRNQVRALTGFTGKDKEKKAA